MYVSEQKEVGWETSGVTHCVCERERESEQKEVGWETSDVCVCVCVSEQKEVGW